MGLTHYSPNEFETVQYDPLEIPKSLALINPKDGFYKPRSTPSSKAQSLLLSPTKMPIKKDDHKSESVLLDKINANERDPYIRRTLNQEAGAEPSLQDKIQNTLVFWKKPKKGDVIDPEAEKKKLAQLNAEDK
ncbi:MAG: DUF3035 domain-containing protein [Alphaproteobacteria bacterium]